MGLTFSRATDQFRLDAYSGLGGFLDGTYLVKHTRETDDKFKERQALAEYPNYVRKIINIYSGFLFQAQPSRQADDLYDQFASNADGTGQSLDVLMLSYQRLAMLLGTLYLIVDKPQGAAATRADEAMPYLAMRLPGSLTDHKKDAGGAFTSATFAETDEAGKLRYRTFTTEGWRLHAEPKGGGLLDQGEYRLGRVPVVRLHSTIPLLPTDIRANPWSHDITQANWSLYNLLSEMRELFRKQTFSILTLPVSNDQEAERLGGLKISVENALTYNPQGGGEPKYIAPPPDPAALYMKAVADTVIRIYQQANLEFVGGVASSGVERKYQFAQTNRALVDMAMLTEQAEREIGALVAAWQGRDWTGVIAYPRDFDLSDLANDLQEALDSQSLGVGPLFDAEIKKQIARRMLRHTVSQQRMEEIDNEIEGGGDPYGDRIAKEAGAATGATP